MIKVVAIYSYVSKKDGRKKYVYVLFKDSRPFGNYITVNPVEDIDEGDIIVCNFGYFDNRYYIKSIERFSD